MASELPGGSGDIAPVQVTDLDTPDAIRTEDVVWGFMRHRFTLDQVNDDSRLDVASPIIPELSSAALVRDSSNADIGQQMAQIADEVDAAYRPQLTALARSLHVTKNTAYEKFKYICQKLFADGVVNWGRIAVLMHFGYHVAVECMQTGVPEFLRQIVKYLVKFIVSEKVVGAIRSIASWVAEQGGWFVGVSRGLGELGATSSHMWLIFGLCITTISAVALLKRG